MKHVCLQMSMVFVSQEHSKCWCMRCKHCALLCLHSRIRSGCGVGRLDALDTCTDMVPHRNGARQEDFIGRFAACGCVRSPMPLEGMGCVRTRRSKWSRKLVPINTHHHQSAWHTLRLGGTMTQEPRQEIRRPSSGLDLFLSVNFPPGNAFIS